MKWKIEYDNDTGHRDEYFREWWYVSDGETTFDCRNEKSAQWLCDLLNKLESTIAEGQQQGEGVSDAMMLKGGNTHQEKFEWLINKCSKLQSQLTVKEKELKHWQELYKDSEKLLLSYDAVPVINFLEKIDSSSMSDKTWLAEQKNLRKEGKELRERLTGKEIEEVKINKVTRNGI